MSSKNRGLFNQAAKDYLIALCTKEEGVKLKAFLFRDLLMDGNSAENVFLRQFGLSGIQLCKNCCPILESFKFSEEIARNLQVAIANIGEVEEWIK